MRRPSVAHLEIFAYFAKISPVRPPRATALARMAADAPTAGSLSQSILGTPCDMILPPWIAVLCGHTAVMAAFVPFRHYMTG